MAGDGAAIGDEGVALERPLTVSRLLKFRFWAAEGSYSSPWDDASEATASDSATEATNPEMGRSLMSTETRKERQCPVNRAAKQTHPSTYSIRTHGRHRRSQQRAQRRVVYPPLAVLVLAARRGNDQRGTMGGRPEGRRNRRLSEWESERVVEPEVGAAG